MGYSQFLFNQPIFQKSTPGEAMFPKETFVDAGARFDALPVIRGGRRRFGVGAKLQGAWGTGVPSGLQGRSPGRGSGDKVPRS